MATKPYSEPEMEIALFAVQESITASTPQVTNPTFESEDNDGWGPLIP